MLKELHKFDLPNGYQPNDGDYIPISDGQNLRAVIDKLNEIVLFVNQLYRETNRTDSIPRLDLGQHS